MTKVVRLLIQMIILIPAIASAETKPVASVVSASEAGMPSKFWCEITLNTRKITIVDMFTVLKRDPNISYFISPNWAGPGELRDKERGPQALIEYGRTLAKKAKKPVTACGEMQIPSRVLKGDCKQLTRVADSLNTNVLSRPQLDLKDECLLRVAPSDSSPQISTVESAQ